MCGAAGGREAEKEKQCSECGGGVESNLYGIVASFQESSQSATTKSSTAIATVEKPLPGPIKHGASASLPLLQLHVSLTISSTRSYPAPAMHQQ